MFSVQFIVSSDFELKKYTKERKEKKPTKAEPEGLEFWICTFYKLYI